MKVERFNIPKGFWRINSSDIFCFLAVLLSTLTIWVTMYLNDSFDDILKYWDGPNYLYAAMTMYKIPKKNPWTVYYEYPPSYFACHLPGYPLLIRLCTFVCFGWYEVGFYMSILVSSLLFVYCFRRFLNVYHCVNNSTLSTIISCFIPLRFTIYHSVGASEPLYISFICMAFIFYRADRYLPMLIFVWLCCITRIEGMAVGFAIGVCYLVSLRIVKAAGMFLTFLAPVALLGMHKYRFNDALAYLHFNQGSQKLIQWPPFTDAIHMQIEELFNYSSVVTLLIGIFGAFLCFEKCIPIAIFALTHLMYVSLLFHIDMFRYQLPAIVFTIIIGYNNFWSKEGVPVILLLFLPFYLFIVAMYAKGQISSNVALDFFLDAMFKSLGYD